MWYIRCGTSATKKADAEKAELRGALSKVIVTEKPNVKWKDVAGLAQAKEILENTVILPTMHPQLFTGIRRPATGILLYGPPGTGEAPINLDPCKSSSSSNLTQYRYFVRLAC